MIRLALRLLLVALLAASLAPGQACTPTPEAPTEFSDLTRFMLRNWDHEEPEVMEGALANLEDFLADYDLLGETRDRSWIPDFLTDEDIEGFQWPDERNLEDAIPVAIARSSVWPVADHARLQSEADQRITEPTAQQRYDRLFLDPADPSCFWDRSCDVMITSNDARRENAAMSVDFILLKDFRWARIGTPEEGEPERWAVVARSWFDESWHGEADNTHLWHSFAVEVWMGVDDETTWRMQCLWSETDVGIDKTEEGIEAIRGTTRWGINGVFEAGEDAIEELYYSE